MVGPRDALPGVVRISDTHGLASYREAAMTTPRSYDVPPALGSVVEEGRGSLPFALIHGEALVTAAVWALGESGVTPVDLGTDWSGLRASGEPFVLHDALCPMTPPAFIAECVARCVADSAVVVGVRPVTDTVKVLEPGGLGDTVDRAGLVTVCSPIVLPAAVVAELDVLPSIDFAALVEHLERRFPVRRVEAPSQARRVASEDGLAVLAALTEPLR
jgi:2-C-methyl-D-erythritol 4-phosphate cytidylyltransferase